MKSQLSQNHGFGGGVATFDISGRVSFDVAQPFGDFEGFIKRCAALVHLRQDEVGASVDDSHDPINSVTHERFTQRPQKGYGTGHTRLEIQIYFVLGCSVMKLCTVFSKQLFIGRHHARTL